MGERDRAAWQIDKAARRPPRRRWLWSPPLAGRVERAVGDGAVRGAQVAGPLVLAYSPCPNDTFIFHAWVHGLLAGAPAVEERLEDIDTLNGLALRGEADVVKVSMYAFARLRAAVRAAALGRRHGAGVGPLVVAPKHSPLPAASACRG